jgi:O-antigen/teichoic acid export membrane protein
MLVSASCSLLHRVVTLVAGLTALWLGASAGTVALAFIVGGLSLIALAWIQMSRRCGQPLLRLSMPEALRLYRLSVPFFSVAALSAIYARGVMIMLGALGSSQAVGTYAVADRLMVPLGLGPNMFNSAVYPALARVAHRSLAEAGALFARCLRLLLVAAIPIAALTMIFAADIVGGFFGAAYLGAVPVVQVLAWTLPIRGAQTLLGSQLAAIDQRSTEARARARLAGLCLFLVLSPLLIHARGIVGAAWAVLICDAVQTGLYWGLLRRARAVPALASSFLAPAAAAAVTLAASALLPDWGLKLHLAAVVLVLSAAMWGLGAIKLHDLRFLRAMLTGHVASPPE